MVSKRCARCRYIKAEHVKGMSYSEALAAEDFGGPCHRFEPKAPLWLRIFNWRA